VKEEEELFVNPDRARRLYEMGLAVQPFSLALLLVRVVISVLAVGGGGRGCMRRGWRYSHSTQHSC
jgi:hypothetical protein